MERGGLHSTTRLDPRVYNQSIAEIIYNTIYNILCHSWSAGGGAWLILLNIKQKSYLNKSLSKEQTYVEVIRLI